MTWKQLTERGHREWKLSAIDPHDTWSEICQACSKPVAWKGAHCCGYGPCTCTLIKNPMMMMMMNKGKFWLNVHRKIPVYCLPYLNCLDEAVQIRGYNLHFQ